MSRRWLLALALAAGCASGREHTPDAATDATSDRGPTTDVAAAETHGDAGPASDARSDRADATAGHGPDAADTRDGTVDVLTDAHPSDGVLVAAFCPSQIPELTIASGTVNGVLKGASNNPAVSCGGGVTTLGPEAFFTLTITDPVTIDLVVAAPVDTLIAIRPGACTDTISELACGEDPPNASLDGGIVAPPPPGDAGSVRLTGLRAPLAAGTYTIIVDTFSLGNLSSANFTLTINHVAPAPNASCATPTLLAAGATATDQPLDLAGAPRTVCGGGAQSSLYYTVGVPSGQRLSARATPQGGDHTWMPRIEAFASCSSNTCLAQGQLVSGTTQQLDWTNNSAAWQLVYLAVGADGPVIGATFDLSVTIVDLFATCNRPMTVKDGTSLTNQDLSIAAPATGPTCSGVIDHAFYYAAALLPQQHITVQTTPSAGTNNFFVPNVSIRQSCDTLSCLSNGSGSVFVNQSNTDTTVLIEISQQQQSVGGLFDVNVQIPPPPPSIVVTPTSGLTTTEAGGSATFTVVLASPPSADVTIGVASDTPTEGTASPATLTFTADNWRTPQTVTVKGVDDSIPDGARDYTIVTSPATSDDANYQGLDADDVDVTNLDNDPGLSIAGAGDVVTSESGTTSTFTVSLNAAPTAPVTMALTSSDVGEGTVSPAQVAFTTANWNVAQTVTVTGVDDAAVDGTQAYTIVTGAFASTDAHYGGQNPPDVSAHNLDDDQVAVGVKLVSAEHGCSGSSGPSLPIAVDRANQIYVIMQCDNGLWSTTSTDAGVTFTVPASISGTEIFNTTAVFAGGAPGFAYLLFGGNDGNTYFLRTTDGGATWSTPVAISDRQDFMHLGAGEKTVMITTPVDDGSNQMVLSRSVDGGRSFVKSMVDGTNLDVTVEPDGRTVWMLETTVSGVDLRKSTDAGATFTRVGPISDDLSFHLIGHNNLFTFANTLQIISLADPTMTQSSIDFISLPPFAMAVDDVDNFTVLDNDPNGHLRATHVVLGAATPTDGRALGPAPLTAGIASLSRKAAAVAFMNGNVVLYTTVVW